MYNDYEEYVKRIEMYSKKIEEIEKMVGITESELEDLADEMSATRTVEEMAAIAEENPFEMIGDDYKQSFTKAYFKVKHCRICVVKYDFDHDVDEEITGRGWLVDPGDYYDVYGALVELLIDYIGYAKENWAEQKSQERSNNNVA